MRFIITNILLLIITALNAQQRARFLSHPALSPDGSRVYFCYEGDIWQVGANGGTAMRVTGMPGYESNIRVSPDGKMLAFSNNQNGNLDAYVLQLDGGEIRQLTFSQGNETVNSWSWDSKSILFTGNSETRQTGYRISANGGTPERLFGRYMFLYDNNIWMHPQTGAYLFNDSWESTNQAYRKRYKGAFAPNVVSYDVNRKAEQSLTNYTGKDFSHSLDAKGNVFYVSDEANGEFNLYTIENGKSKALTNYNTSIKNPLVNAAGTHVVFEKDYELFLYNIGTKRATPLAVNVVRNYVLPRNNDYTTQNQITAADIAGDGKKIAFVSRGELFISDIEGKYITQLNRNSTERVTGVKWLNDNKTLLILQTNKGYANAYTIAADGSVPLRLLGTGETKTARFISTNNKRNMAAFISGRGEVKLYNHNTGELKTIVRDEIWGNRGSTPYFSPDDAYIVFNVYRDFETDIMVYNMASGKTINLTRTGVTEEEPMWSPDGKYIYFTGNPLQPSYPFGLDPATIYRLPLQKQNGPFVQDKIDALFNSAKKDTTAKKDSVQNRVVINEDDILERMERIGPTSGNQVLVGILQKGDKQMVLYMSDHGEGNFGLWKTTFEPFEKTKTERITGIEGFSAELFQADGKYYLRNRGMLHKLNLDQNKAEPISISYHFSRNLQGEFNQMFEEAWSQMEENFYDETFRGINWKSVKEYYASFLPYVNNRQDVRILINDMLGELNASHTGFRSTGVEENTGNPVRSMEPGIVFNPANPFTVERVIKRGPADKQDVDIRPGDILVAVNNRPVNPDENRDRFFSFPSVQNEMQLTFKRGTTTQTVKLKPAENLQNELYSEWEDACQKRVDEKSGNKIGYMHMRDMGQEELERFYTDMARDFYHKDALILDLRYNTGGNVHDKVLRFLSQREYMKWKYRGGELTGQSNFAPADKPIVLLINEQSLSDAEVTANGFKALKLGTIIGNETYRWIVFTTATTLVDGSTLRLPSWGCYTLDGKDIEFNGVQPDIKIINSFADNANGIDRQLDTAIEHIMKQLNTRPARP